MKRSRFSETQIIGILKEVDSCVMTVQDLCRKHGVSDAAYYKWKSTYGGLKASDLKRLRELEGGSPRRSRITDTTGFWARESE